MSINFPTSLDSLTNPAGTDRVSVVDHASQHANANDAIEAIEAKVGVDSSAVTTTLDYKLKSTSSSDPGHKHTEASVVLADVTTLDVSSTKHGFTPKSPADATKFLNGAATPAYALVKDSDLSTSDITTNDLSSTKHGFAPKTPNDSSKFLNGTGGWTIPGAGATFVSTSVFANATPPTVATDLDLSAVVGAATRLALLKVVLGTTVGGGTFIAFVTKGDTCVVHAANGGSGGVDVAGFNGSDTTGTTRYVVVKTSSAGVVQWITDNSGTAGTVAVSVIAYL